MYGRWSVALTVTGALIGAGVTLVVFYFTALLPLSSDVGEIKGQLAGHSAQFARLDGRITGLEASLVGRINEVETDLKTAIVSHVHGADDTIFFRDIASAAPITAINPVSQDETLFSFTVSDLEPCTVYELEVALNPDFSDAKRVEFKTLCGTPEEVEGHIYTVDLGGGS